MRRRECLLLAVALAMVVAGYTIALRFPGIPRPRNGRDGDGAGPPGSVGEIVAAMSLDQKIGQLFMFGVPGTTVDVDDATAELVRRYAVGGFILFRGNIQSARQTVELTNALRSLNAGNPLPLFIAADQEGGRVHRLPPEATPFPAAARVGGSRSPELAGQIGRAMGEELQALGINVDLAPVLDVNTNPDNPVIGDRAFGSDAALVETIGIAVMKGLQSTGTVTAVKHFPGHGDTSLDSHVELPVLDHDRSRLDSVELRPFAAAIRSGADMVMPAHVAFTSLDPAGSPASLSSPVLTGLLRGELGFDGVIITDALTMGAITRNYTPEQAMLAAIAAGADVLLLPAGAADQVAAVETLRAAAASGALSAERIDQSVRRVAALKLRYGLSDASRSPDAAAEVLARRWHREAVAAVLD